MKMRRCIDGITITISFDTDTASPAKVLAVISAMLGELLAVSTGFKLSADELKKFSTTLSDIVVDAHNDVVMAIKEAGNEN